MVTPSDDKFLKKVHEINMALPQVVYMYNVMIPLNKPAEERSDSVV